MVLLGPHIQKSSPAASRWATVAPIVKQLDGTDALRAAPDSALRILRVYVGDSNLRVQDVFDAVMRTLGGYRHSRLYIEPVNMIDPAKVDEGIAFFRQIVPMFHAVGVQVAGPTWATGNPEKGAYVQWRAAGFAGINLLTFHTYFGNEGLTEWHALRPLKLWQPGDPDFALVEGGRDAVEGGQGGWRKDGVSPEQYVSELFAMEAEYAKCPGFRGFTPFTCAPNGDWLNFNMDPLVDLILAHQDPTPEPPKPTGPTYPLVGAFIAAYQPQIDGDTTAPAVYALKDDRPPEYHLAVQFAENSVLVYTGSSVRRVLRGT